MTRQRQTVEYVLVLAVAGAILFFGLYDFDFGSLRRGGDADERVVATMAPVHLDLTETAEELDMTIRYPAGWVYEVDGPIVAFFDSARTRVSDDDKIQPGQMVLFVFVPFPVGNTGQLELPDMMETMTTMLTDEDLFKDIERLVTEEVTVTSVGDFTGYSSRIVQRHFDLQGEVLGFDNGAGHYIIAIALGYWDEYDAYRPLIEDILMSITVAD